MTCKHERVAAVSDLYDTDIVHWSEHQAELLRRRAAGELINEADLDWLNIAEEIESVGSERHAFAAGLSVAAVALARHFAQTNADRQRRITESFSKAAEQLGSDKLEVRLGGIYSLERISKESPDDYWTVMENLTAFVRERSRRNEAERTSQDFEQRISRRAYFLWWKAGRPEGQAENFWAEAVKQEEFGEPPATDIVAVLTVIKRRMELSREREVGNNWRLDLSGAILKRADLWEARLEGADLRNAHLEGAILLGAHLEEAHLEGADLSYVMGLSEAQLAQAHGDAVTKLPAGLARPAHWDCRKIWGQAAMAIGGNGSFAGRNFCPKPEPRVPL